MSVKMSEISLDKKSTNKNINTTLIGEIKIRPIDLNYTFYRRNYQKIQSLLADVMSIVNILISIGKMISYLLLQKKMNKDIVRSIINRNIYTKLRENALIVKNRKTKRLFNEKTVNTINSDINNKNNINKNITKKTDIKDNSNKLSIIN